MPLNRGISMLVKVRFEREADLGDFPLLGGIVMIHASIRRDMVSRTCNVYNHEVLTNILIDVSQLKFWFS
ncbi:hypothetical protein NS31R_15920 [Enterobacter cancerogenus]|nr:hypothetical protein NS104_05655 [Enterobacter cancerogenus]KTQ51781.1 hypothetical protein NS111_11965 [Enterobacter cancerogenus]KTQ73255.1 hypothetical protein NS188_12535 [Enterobacter cancerogenus]KTQ79005.1 hypothetical protein NS31R_15920 [Enterobacter cancerogenus]